MNISPVNFKRVETLPSANFNTALSNAYLQSGESPDSVNVEKNSIVVNDYNKGSKKEMEFDDSGNMKTQTIYSNNTPLKKIFYYPEIGTPSAAIEYNKNMYRSNTIVKEVSLYNRHGVETDNFNYDTREANVNDQAYVISSDNGKWTKA